jgi:hypothetical protein
MVSAGGSFLTSIDNSSARFVVGSMLLPMRETFEERGEGGREGGREGGKGSVRKRQRTMLG